jgi:outer membrane lipoprotein-sorting protein
MILLTLRHLPGYNLEPATIIMSLPFLLPLSGCHTPDPIPTYPSAPANESFDRMQTRLADVRDISGEGEITLVDTIGNSVRFDAAFALAPPDRARVRAWKLSQAVLDLTVTRDGAWLFLPKQNDQHADKLRAAASDASRALHEWLELLSSRPDAGADDVRTTGDQFIVTRHNPDGSRITSVVDRATLTARQYTIFDRAGKPRFSLAMEQYRVVGSTVWPTRIEAAASNGKFIIELRDLAINQAPPLAFQPPARAERLP